jgi:exonuclease V gamma subunit
MTQIIDVTGLSAESVQMVTSLVESLRRQEETSSKRLSPEEWSKALRQLAESFPPRVIEIDDSREAIYAGRGE